MRIERAAERDAAVLTRIARAAKKHWGYSDEWMGLWSGDLTVTVEGIANDAFYCVRDGDRPVAFYAVSFDGDEAAELEHFWVEPDSMGRGIGRAMLEHAAGVVREAGRRRLVIASDPHAEDFYRRMGAVRVGEVASTPAPRVLPLLELIVSA